MFTSDKKCIYNKGAADFEEKEEIAEIEPFVSLHFLEACMNKYIFCKVDETVEE